MSGTSIKIENATLDDDSRGIVVKGFIDPDSLKLLKVDEYQREELSEAKIRELMEALRTGRVPDIEVGMRGDDVITRDSVFYLQNPTYIVDGLQRVTAGIRLVDIEPEVRPRIGVTVHLNTDFDWERRRFKLLNVGQTKLNGNVTLRNMRYDSETEVVQVLYNLSTGKNNKAFAMHGRICWEQTMKRSEFISATAFAKVVGMLHSYIGPGRSSNGTQLANGLQKILMNTGRNTFLGNIRLFFEIIDKAYGIQTVSYKETANHLKISFLLALARLFADCDIFWEGAKFVIDEPTIKKLSSFNLNDPSVTALCGSGGKSSEILTTLLFDHINYNRRSKKLVRRSYDDVEGED